MAGPIYSRDRILRAYEVAMSIDPDHDAAVSVVAQILAIDPETVSEVVSEKEEA